MNGKELTGRLRFVVRDINEASRTIKGARILQQEWENQWTGKKSWKDVPVEPETEEEAK